MTEAIHFGNDVHPSVATLRPLSALRRNECLFSIGIGVGFPRNTQLRPDFAKQVERGVEAALELEEMFLTRQPEEIFAAEAETDFLAWCEFFGRTREADGRRKGLVEIIL